MPTCGEQVRSIHFLICIYRHLSLSISHSLPPKSRHLHSCIMLHAHWFLPGLRDDGPVCTPCKKRTRWKSLEIVSIRSPR